MLKHTVIQIDFVGLFNFAKEKYDIPWNLCNTLFFKNEILQYKSVTDFCYGEWQGYCNFWKDETSFEIKASSFLKEEVLAMEDDDKAYVILAAYIESLGITEDEIQIDCR